MDEQNVLKMQQRKDFLIKFCYWAVIAVFVYAVFKYLLPVLFPFVLSYGIAYMLAKPVCRIAGESTVCGVEYVPGSAISKYCPACARKIQREKSNESKRRSREQKRMIYIELR